MSLVPFKSCDHKGVVHTLSGAISAIRTVIKPPCDVPNAKAFLIPRASITWMFMCAAPHNR